MLRKCEALCHQTPVLPKGGNEGTKGGREGGREEGRKEKGGRKSFEAKFAVMSPIWLMHI
jgi:hypothetical protein